MLLPHKPEPIHSIKFDDTDVEKIQKAATKTQIDSGPPCIDANGWKRILTSKHRKKVNISMQGIC